VNQDIRRHDSGHLVAALIRHDLINEYRLMVFPTAQAPGKRV
jgi:hypothetical protein